MQIQPNWNPNEAPVGIRLLFWKEQDFNSALLLRSGFKTENVVAWALEPDLEEVDINSSEDRVTLDKIPLTVRSANALRDAGVKRVDQLLALTSRTIWSIDNVGEKSAFEIAWTCVKILKAKVNELRTINETGLSEEIKLKAKKYDELIKFIKDNSVLSSRNM